jgi:hypothetical protein
MAAQSIPDWENLSSDEKYVYEALAQLGFSDFATLSITDQSLCLALACHLKRSQRTAAIGQA